jgi:hypothetical protein
MPEHYWVRHAGEVPFRVPMQVGGWQRVKGAQGRLVARGGTRVPGDEDVTARGNPVHCGVDIGVVGCRCAAQTDGKAWPEDRALPRRGGGSRADGFAALGGGAFSLPSLRPRLA